MMTREEVKAKLEEIYHSMIEVLQDSEQPNIDDEIVQKLQQTVWILQDALDLDDC